ncbi:hypothetical protein HBI82_048960 [Parastagonospora nodorum]|nr:hypothetical protein HBI09_191510 [Parastagonospora nodorum]KAH4978659.1 hypothetical protein HBI76_207560 [Parastagonospora nodorum]KAH4991846.1 hypothetical protein HBI77_211740 [Parastagonospora nodorum]KAH5206559.1 hypothetical protein HBH77_094800 [Parastagonospora nodorum]KAH5804762.1 hypothetical protein HBI94_186800 [Parastagonospora nodorum]
MAAISQPAPLAGESLLEKLPTELLEKVLLEVVNGVTSPSEYTGNRPNLLRCNLEITSGTSIASLLLKHRLVSRTIRMNSWRSLAKVLGETIFDMCSKESMANLVALTSCMSLAPWINKLTVSCFKVKKTYPFSDCILEYEEGYDNAVAHLGSIVPRAWRRPSSTVSAVPISKASFPNLTSLSVKLGNVDITLRNRNLLLCQVLDVPELRHVSITGGGQTDPQLLGFLELIEGPIRSVSLRDMRAVSYEPILKVLQSLELDVLAIHDRYGIWWEGDTYDEREFRGVPKGFLESVAKSGIFGPELLDEELEDELEVELEEGLEE